MGFSDDDDFDWEFEDIWRNTIDFLVYCELEDGLYHYMIMGRLMTKQENAYRNYKINSLEEILKLQK